MDPTERANVELKKHVKNAKPRVSTRHNGGSGGSFKKKGGRREAEGEYIWIDVTNQACYLFTWQIIVWFDAVIAKFNLNWQFSKSKRSKKLFHQYTLMR